MIHKIRWTAQKIAQRIKLIESLVYQRRQPMGTLRYKTLPDPMTTPPVAVDVDDSDWEVIEPHSHWGKRYTNFVLRTEFTVPADWGYEDPVALYLPLGEAGDFSHPEALAYIDGVPYAACDRHHQEIILPAHWCDGQTHPLALHGWTGLLGGYGASEDQGLYMQECAVVQIDQSTRDFLATARVAQGIAETLDENEPAKGRLLNALRRRVQVSRSARTVWR